MKIRLVSLGCKVNQYETQALASLFLKEGFELTDGSDADAAVINSCTVTSLADRKSRQLLRRLRREMPDCVIALAGCLPQASPQAAAELVEADIITGTKDRSALVSLVRARLEQGGKSFGVSAFAGDERFEPLFAERFPKSFQRAYLKIEDGCDRFCSYCIIPYARGRVRSLLPEQIAAEAARLAAEGYREIVLTGINLSRYGADINLTLADAIEAAASAPGDFRLRLGSVEPDLISPADWERLSKIGRLCPHFHIAAQSGCDKTLAAMNRRYGSALLLETAQRINSLFPNPAITADFIAGFPGESEADFEETCRTVERLGLLRAHIFEYSPRKGTPAARMPEQLPPPEKKRRARALEQICRQSGERFAQGQVGKTAEVLLEGAGGGYAANYLYVKIPEPKGHAPGEIINVELASAQGGGCIGIIKQ